MKDLILIRIEELVQEINTLLANRDKLSLEMNRTNNEITSKKGAIIELKGLIDISETEVQHPEKP